MLELLGRDEIKIDIGESVKELNGKTVLVTGAAGSIGSALSRELSKINLKRLLLIDLDETRMVNLVSELNKDFVEPFLVDVFDSKEMGKILRSYKPYVVFHCAAYKHVGILENMIETALINNTFATMRLQILSVAHSVEYFVFLSTDKAVEPTCVMGASKRLAEALILSTENRNHKVVRLCNVIGSRGSVIPMWEKQSETGKIKVTQDKVSRYFITETEAAKLIISAISQDKKLILPTAEAKEIEIIELAKRFIKSKGTKIKIERINLAPGEKVSENLSYEKEKFDGKVHDYIFKTLFDLEFDIKFANSKPKFSKSDLFRLVDRTNRRAK